MITEKQIEIATVLIGTGLIEKVFHSVELVEDKEGVKFPAFKKGKEQFYVGPNDTVGRFAYIRQNGQVGALEEIMEGSCSKAYKVRVPLRIVVFKDHEQDDFDLLIKKLLKPAFMKDITFVSFSNNAFQLGKQESPVGDFAFDATTFYLAIDVQAKIVISQGNCEENNCIVHPNPICK